MDSHLGVLRKEAKASLRQEGNVYSKSANGDQLREEGPASGEGR